MPAKKKIIAGLASIPNRITNLQKTVDSIIDQVDELHVFLNGYKSIPDFLDHDKIIVYESKDHFNRGDAGKFYALKFVDKGTFIGIDDDLIYPDDYVKTITKGLKKYKGCVVSFHGRRFAGKIRNYKENGKTKDLYPMQKGKHNWPHCLYSWSTDCNVHTFGTGVCAFDIEAMTGAGLTFERLAAKPMNMADVHFTLWAQENGIPRRVLAHKGNWIKQQKTKDSIYGKSNGIQETQLIHNITNWELY